MESTLFNFLLKIPETLSGFASWLVTPINETYFNVAPLTLLSVGGVAILIGLIVVHVVMLFIP